MKNAKRLADKHHQNVLEQSKGLQQRHEAFGRSAQAAQAWVDQTDEPNARLIAATRARARLVFRWDRG